MKFAMKQQVFSLKETFHVMSESGENLYEIKGKMISLGHKLTMYDMGGNEVAYIHQKLVSLVPKYFIEIPGENEVELKGHITLLKPHYTLETDQGNWEIKGDFLQHEYEMKNGDDVVATVSKKWLSFGDAYVIDVKNELDALKALGVVLAIDCTNQDTNLAQSRTIENAAK